MHAWLELLIGGFWWEWASCFVAFCFDCPDLSTYVLYTYVYPAFCPASVTNEIIWALLEPFHCSSAHKRIFIFKHDVRFLFGGK